MISYGDVTKIPRDDGLLSEPTTEVNGNDPYCKRVPRDKMAPITRDVPNAEQNKLTNQNL